MCSKNNDNPSLSAGSKSMEDNGNAGEDGGKTSLAAVKWHSAPSTEREDDRPSTATVFKTTATTMVDVTAGGWKPLQRQKVVTAASTLEDDDDRTADGENERATATERVRKRAVVMVRRGYSCQESCAVRRPMTMNSCGCVGNVAGGGAAVTASSAGENRRRWLSADTGNGHATAGNSRSMECLQQQSSLSSSSSPHRRTSFIMVADDRKSLDAGLDDAAAATAATVEMADRRRGAFASTRTSVPSHLSLALPSCERRLTILSPHTHAPSASVSTESGWHFCTTSSSTSATIMSSLSSSSAAATTAVTTAANVVAKSRNKSRPGMVLPRLVLPASSDLDIFSQ